MSRPDKTSSIADGSTPPRGAWPRVPGVPHIVHRPVATIADDVVTVTVPLIQNYADDVVTVKDLEISEAVLLLMERCKQIVEPSGAAPVAAVLMGKVDVKGKTSCACSPAATST